jgi:glycosyltransferase involved in cell wall biosynthesis
VARTVVVTTHAPGKGSGANLVSLGRLDLLKRLGHEVTLVRQGEGGLDPAAIGEVCAEVIERPRRRPSAGKVARDLFGVLGRGYLARWDEAAWEALQGAIAAKKPDLVWIDGLFAAEYGRRLKRRGFPGRIVLQEHNVEFSLLERRLLVTASAGKRFEIAGRIRRFRDLETHLDSCCDVCMALTEEDRKLLSRLNPGFPVHFLPPAVDTAHYRRRGDERSRRDLLFIGAYSWPPNLDGIEWFVRDVFPAVQARVPDVHLTVVGKDPPAWLAALGTAVEVTGFVEDERPYYERARALVVPLRFGGGVRIKILNAMAMATPVVSTTLGAEGIPAFDGEDLLLADAPEALADRIVRVLEDDALAARLAENGHRVCLSHYGEDAIARRLGQLLEA